MASRQAEPADSRLAAVDGLRAVALLSAMTFHYTLLQSDGSLLGEVLTNLLHMMRYGVELFFVISGFVITRLLLRRRERAGFIRDFFIARGFRILPLYFIFLFLFLVVVPLVPFFGRWNDFWQYDRPPAWQMGLFWVHLSNVFLVLHGGWSHRFLDVSWSLAVQEHFYLVWPFVVARLGVRKLAWVCAGILVFCLGVRVWMVLAMIDPIAAYVLTPARMDMLAAGALVAVAQHAGWLRFRGALVMFVACMAGYFVLCLVARYGYPQYAIHYRKLFYIYHPFIQTVGYTLLIVGFGCLIAHALMTGAGGRLGRALSHPWLCFLGRAGYPAYLFHLPAGFVVEQALAGLGLSPRDYLGQFLLLAGATGLTVAVAWALHRGFEMPVAGLRERWFPRSEARARG